MIKELYKFTVTKKLKEPQKEESVNEAGDKVTIERETEVEKPIEFCIRKPNAKMVNNAQLFYNVQVGKGIQEGLISQALLFKKLKNEGGLLTEADKEDYTNKITEYFQLRTEHESLLAVEDSLKTDEQKERVPKLVGKLKTLEKELQEIQTREDSIYNITAESWARTKTILWWLLFLLHEKVDGDWKPVFVGESFNDKYNDYCALDDDDRSEEEQKFISEAIQHGQRAVVTWYYGSGNDQVTIEEALKKFV